MKAACSALTPALRDGLNVCQQFTQGTCAPGSQGDRVCGSAKNFELNRSVCKEVGDSYRYDVPPDMLFLGHIDHRTEYIGLESFVGQGD